MDGFDFIRLVDLRDQVIETSIIDAKKLCEILKNPNKQNEKNYVKLNEIIMFYKSHRFSIFLFDKNYGYKDFIELNFNQEEKEIMRDVERKYECCKRNIKNGYAFTTKNNLCYVKIGLFGCLLKNEETLSFSQLYANSKILDVFDHSGNMIVTTRTTGTITLNRHYKTLYRSEINKISIKRGYTFKIAKKDKEIVYYRFGSHAKEILINHDTNVIFDNIDDKNITGIYNLDGHLISYQEE